MSLNCSDRATKEDLYGLLFSLEVFNCNLACEDLSSKRLSRQTATCALCSKKASRQTASLSPWRIKGVCHSAPLSINCFLLSCVFVSILTRSVLGVCHSALLSDGWFFCFCIFVSILSSWEFSGNNPSCRQSVRADCIYPTTWPRRGQKNCSCIFVSILTRSVWGVYHSALLSIDWFLLSYIFVSILTRSM